MRIGVFNLIIFFVHCSLFIFPLLSSTTNNVQESFTDVTNWLKDVETYASETITLMLIENKCDLKKTKQRMVAQRAGEVGKLYLCVAHNAIVKRRDEDKAKNYLSCEGQDDLHSPHNCTIIPKPFAISVFHHCFINTFLSPILMC